MRIAVDIDGVLLDIMITYCEIFNRKNKTNYQKKDVKNWEFFKDWKISEQEAFEIFHEIYEDSTLVPFIDANVPGIMKELNKIHEVYIVTARQPKYRAPILKKLNSHDVRRNVQYRELILLQPKPYDIKLRENFDFYIDDNPNLVDPIKKLKGRTLLLFDQPWNQSVNIERNVTRVFNWDDIYQYIINL
jgi:5'(3')-deoxyribonucleotidase